MDPAAYCREIEAYLCRKNDGHLIRIVGPAFETVSGWAAQGIPFKVACRGIDRYFERYYAKGPRRRPVRIEFCEADVFDAFDDWRRAVGVTSTAPEAIPGDPPQAHGSLPAHLQRVLEKLTGARVASRPELTAAIDRAIEAVEALRQSARSFRGQAREQAIERLAAVERDLLDFIRRTLAASERAQLTREAEEELAGFLARMPESARAQAVGAAEDRLLRERLSLPRIRYE